MMSLFVFPASISLAHASSTVAFPAYATSGSFANYTGSGGFIAFLSGVSGNITYYVNSVSPNGTMKISVNGNLSLGTEAGIPASQVSETLNDSAFDPRILPAVPPQNLTNAKIDFQNITCYFVKNAAVTVPAGTFNATEFQGTGVNDSVLDFWFDRPSGLAVQMAGSAAEFQLLNSNIAVPIGLSSNAYGTQIIIVFLVGWTGAGLLFYSVRRYYLKKSKYRRFEEAPEDKAPPTGSKKPKSGKN